MNNDTISGNILLNDKANVGYMTIVKFWNSINQKVKEYRADKIKAFGFGERYFESLIWEEAHYYFERIVNGRPVSLYVTPYSYWGVILPLSVRYDEYFIVDSSAMTRLNRLGFRNFMMNYVKGCPILVNKIEVKEQGFDDLVQIIQEYNSCSK